MGPHTRIRSRSKQDSFSFVLNKAMENKRAMEEEKVFSYEEKAFGDERALEIQKAVEDDTAMENQDKTSTDAKNMIHPYAKACLLLKFKLFMAITILVSLPSAYYLLLTNVILRYTLLSGFNGSILEFDGAILPKFNASFLRVKHFCDGLPESTQCYKTFMFHNLAAASIIFAIGLAYLFAGFKVANRIRRRCVILQGRLDIYESRLNAGLKLEAQKKDEAEKNSHFGDTRATDL